MDGVKPWYTSKTIRFAVATLALLIIVLVCVAKGWELGQIIALVTAIAGLLGTIWGRFVAEQKIGKP